MSSATLPQSLQVCLALKHPTYLYVLICGQDIILIRLQTILSSHILDVECYASPDSSNPTKH
jgi:hypothetical protein